MKPLILLLGLLVPALPPARFSTQQLQQLVAPIALYEDSLLSQVFMAATYPLDVVEAARWVADHPDLAGHSLESALMGQPWDPSVKSICGLPEVLQPMSDDQTWTQDLGDAFLAQPADLMEAVQRMRHLAQDEGNLDTNAQQVVTDTDEGDLAVESEDDSVVYVPTYYPTGVYGRWRYPHWYYPRRYPTATTGAHRVAFAEGAAWGAAMWGECDWTGNAVYVDVDRYNRFVGNAGADPRRERITARGGAREEWRHDPARRRGVAYRDPQVAQRYGGAGVDAHVSHERARGHERHEARTGSSSATRHDERAGRSTARQDARTTRHDERHHGSSSSYSGSSDPELDHASSERGASSRRSGGARRVRGRVR